MKKKIMIFGMISILALALVSAGLVSYLSNPITGTVTVKSPLELSVTNGVLDSLEGHRLNVIDFTLINNADISVSTIVELSVSGDAFNESNFGAEFETFLIGMKMPTELPEGVTAQLACESQPLGGEFNETEGYCYWDTSTDKDYTGIVNGVYYAQMGDRLQPTPIEAGQTLNGRLKLRFQTNVVGEYTLSAQALVPELSKDLR